jgi:hypothetical protein
LNIKQLLHFHIAYWCLGEILTDGRKNSFYFDVTAADNDASLIARGDAHGRVSLKAGVDRLMVVVVGEPTGECLLECFRAGIEQKILLPDTRATRVSHICFATRTLARPSRF